MIGLLAGLAKAADGKDKIPMLVMVWIDWIGYKLVPFVATEHPTNRKRGLICMAIRGAVFSLLLFTFLGIAGGLYLKR